MGHSVLDWLLSENYITLAADAESSAESLGYTLGKITPLVLIVGIIILVIRRNRKNR